MFFLVVEVDLPMREWTNLLVGKYSREYRLEKALPIVVAARLVPTKHIIATDM